MKVFRIELKKCIKQIAPYYIVFIIFLMVFAQFGIINMKSIYEGETNLKNLESNLIRGYISYHQYGSVGMRLKFKPAPISILFIKTVPFLDMTAFIDIGFKLYTYKGISSNNAIAQNGYLDISWILKIFGCLMVLMWGWKTFRDKENLKFLISIYGGDRRVKTEILISRITVLLIGIILIYGLILVHLSINGFFIDCINLGAYIFVVFLIYVMWFLTAAFMGIKSSKWKKILIAIIWILFVIILPELLNYYFDRSAKQIGCIYIHEAKKADIVKKVEKEALAKATRYPTKEQKFKSDVESAKKYWNKDWKEIEKLEKQLIDQLEKVIRKYQFVSSLTPMSFLYSTECEVSSQGFNGYLVFYKYLLKKQRYFLKYIYDKLYFKGPNYGPVEPFLKDKETIYRFPSAIPQWYWLGVVCCLAIISLLLWGNYRTLKKALYKDESEKVNEFEMVIYESRINILLTGLESLKQQVFNNFAGKVRVKGNINIKTSNDEVGNNFVYLYKKADMEANFTKNEMTQLLNEHGENWEIIFKNAKAGKKVLILVDFFEGLNDKEIIKIVQFIKDKKLSAIIITNNKRLACWLVPAEKINVMPDDDSVDLK